jgi:U3 small nucleolar RNA-associated protein 11
VEKLTLTKIPVANKEEAMEIEKLRHARYAELDQRLKREKELNVVLQKLELKKELAVTKRRTAPPKLISKGNKDKPAVFKWKYERKK